MSKGKILNGVRNNEGNKRGDKLVKVEWKLLKEVDPNHEYLAFSQYGELKNTPILLAWYMRSRKVTEQVKNAKGLVGFTMEAGFWSKKGLIVGVFEDEPSLMEFAHTGQHAECLAKSKLDVKGGMSLVRWSILGSALPPKLEDAMRLHEKKATA